MPKVALIEILQMGTSSVKVAFVQGLYYSDKEPEWEGNFLDEAVVVVVPLQL